MTHRWEWPSLDTRTGLGRLIETLNRRLRDLGMALRGKQSDLGWFNVKDYGATGNGVTDDTAAIRSALDAATSAGGGMLFLPSGTYVVSAQITIPNRISLRGTTPRSSVIKASANFSDSWILNAINGSSSMFDAKLIDLMVDCNDVSGVGGILSDAMQENSGLCRVVVDNWRTSGLRLQNGYGGASHVTLEDVELYASGSNGTYGIDCDTISLVGGFMLVLDGVTITGSSGTPLTAGVRMVNDSVIGRAVHVENCSAGISLDGLGSSVLDGITGASDVTTVVQVESTFAGRVSARGVHARGATNTIVNGVTGETFASASFGSVTEYTYSAGTSLQQSDANARVAVRKNSAGSIYKRRRLNLIEADSQVLTATVSDDSANEEVDVTLALTGRFNSALSMGAGVLANVAFYIRSAFGLSGSTSQYGVLSEPTGGSDGTSELNAVASRLRTSASAYTVVAGYGLRVLDAVLGAGSAITTQYGLKIDNQTQGGTNYAIHTGTGTNHFGDLVQTPASTSAGAGLNVPHGAAPSSPTNGDIWTTTAGMYVRVNGSTVGPLGTGGGGGGSGWSAISAVGL